MHINATIKTDRSCIRNQSSKCLHLNSITLTLPPTPRSYIHTYLCVNGLNIDSRDASLFAMGSERFKSMFRAFGAFLLSLWEWESVRCDIREEYCIECIYLIFIYLSIYLYLYLYLCLIYCVIECFCGWWCIPLTIRTL